MNYLERNKLLVQEAQQCLIPIRGKTIGRSSNNRFVTLGHYKSEILGQDLFVGLKEFTRGRDRRDAYSRRRLKYELVIIEAIADQFPRLSSELPTFYALLLNKRGAIGIITEDFSQNGLHRVEDTAFPYPEELEKFSGRNRGDLEIEKACFTVFSGDTRTRRIGDFNTLLTSESEQQLHLQYSPASIMAEIDSYSLLATKIR